jgi:hypothetical protein
VLLDVLWYDEFGMLLPVLVTLDLVATTSGNRDAFFEGGENS